MFEDEVHNWVLALKASCQARDALLDHVKTVIIKLFHPQRGTVKVCGSCETKDLVGCIGKCFNGKYIAGYCDFHQLIPHEHKRKQCPNNVCSGFVTQINKCKRNGWHPAWPNTDARKWKTNVLEVAKCFVPVNRFLYTRDMKDTGLTGLIRLIQNCTSFDTFLQGERGLLDQVCVYVSAVLPILNLNNNK